MLYKKEAQEDLIWGIWKIEESTDDLLSMLDNTIELASEKRLFERAAVRVLLKNLLGKEEIIYYKESGKPYLKSDWFISISHTKGYVAVSLSKKRETGIDLEYISNKVKRIESRFISDSEYISTENEIIHLLLHWSAKEAVYKITNTNRTSLKEDFIVKKFMPSTSGIFSIKETDSGKLFDVNYFVEEDFVITII